MRISRSLVQVTVTLAAAGCSTQHDGPTASRVVSASRSENAAVEVSVSGGGIIDLSTAGVGDAHFAFNAVRKADGRVYGNFHERRERAGLVIEFVGIVTCVTVDPILHRARVGGVITENRSTDPAFLTTNHEVGD